MRPKRFYDNFILIECKADDLRTCEIFLNFRSANDFIIHSTDLCKFVDFICDCFVSVFVYLNFMIEYTVITCRIKAAH